MYSTGKWGGQTLRIVGTFWTTKTHITTMSDSTHDNGVATAATASNDPFNGTGVECQGCKQMYASRNAIFRHLKDTNGACLSPADHADFVKFVRNRDRTKALLLYGYIPSQECLQLEVAAVTSSKGLIRNGDDAAQVLLEVVEQVTMGTDDDDDDDDDPEQQPQPPDSTNDGVNNNRITLINRSYGCKSRNSECVAQDDGTGAITEVLTTKLPSLCGGEAETDAWIDQINQALQERLQQDTAHIHLLARLELSHKKFHAEMDVTHRRVDYLLPADFLFHDKLEHVQSRRDYFLSTFEPFCSGHNPYPNNNINNDNSNNNNNNKDDHPDENDDDATTTPQEDLRPTKTSHPSTITTDTMVKETRRDTQTIFYLHSIKKMMQRLTTPIVELDMDDAAAVMEKDFNQQKRKRNRSTQERHLQHQQQKKQPIDIKPPKVKVVDVASDATLPRMMASVESAPDEEDATKHEAAPGLEQKEASGHDKKESTLKKSAVTKEKSSTTASKKGKNLLRRRRFHNFTPRVMAHEFLAYRRMDRLYHRATIRIPFSPQPKAVSETLVDNQPLPPPTSRAMPLTYPFVALSMSGDMFLMGQACRVVGLLIALVRGIIDVDIIDCIFDEAFPHLVPVPPAPSLGLLAGEAAYMTWEGRSELILTPRRCDRYPKGFNQPSTLRKVEEWQKQAHQHIAEAWLNLGFDLDGRLTAERIWTETVLEPWAVRAREQLEEYRTWKSMNQDVATTATASSDAEPVEQLESENSNAGIVTPPMPSLSSIDTTVPTLYQKVLECLRQADASGLWPTTTPKRQLVMVTTPKEIACDNGGAMSNNNDSLMVAHIKAKQNKRVQSSAYTYVEGEGGASGSFSVGAMPGDLCLQPKGNKLFPELMKAAFELEIALCPHRPPSSTIAINRNAQFRPHTDSGAGAGQSTSLIVGLGDYVGGELVVEGQKKDIRYQPIEFNGWKQRHWTMPFQGERFTLVWFTPKGCEDVRGIDLCV